MPMRGGDDPRCVILENGARLVIPSLDLVPTSAMGLAPGSEVIS